MFDLMRGLDGPVPGSESMRVRCPLFPVRRLWNRQPELIRRRVKRLLGRSACAARTRAGP